MKSLSITWSLLTFVVAAMASVVACGAETNSGAPGGGASSNAGKGSTNGGAGAGASNAGSSSGGSNNNGGAASSRTCPASDCGPALGVGSTMCSDGSVSGPTGVCLRLANGGCGWELRTCPSPSEGGAAGSGGTSTTGGAGAAGASDGGASGAGGAPATDQCGGCTPNGQNRQICVYQSGGPGAGRFVCATQNPCGAAGACACIVGQGTCGPMLEGGSPGYCVCDNGLD